MSLHMPEQLVLGLSQHGCIPTHLASLQVTSYKMAVRMESEVVGGPTAQGQPVFEWGNSWPDFEHRGMPNR